MLVFPRRWPTAVIPIQSVWIDRLNLISGLEDLLYNNYAFKNPDNPKIR
jgi:hypothetical protein